jgi:hypothetical protein
MILKIDLQFSVAANSVVSDEDLGRGVDAGVTRARG